MSSRVHKYQSECPNHFVEDVFEKTFQVSSDSVASVWDKLQRRETFIQGQVFPYRVEFESSLRSGQFEPGELNIHHGPLLSVHGVIGELNPGYRDLRYYYGSYVLSFRLIRPVRLEFIRNQTEITLRLTSYVRPFFKPIWRSGNQFFWSFFKLSI